MADIIKPTGSNEAVKLWTNRLMMDTIMGTPFFSDALSDGIILRNDDLSKGAGDRIRMYYSKRSTSKGVVGDSGSIRAAATSVTTVTDDLNIDQLSLPLLNKTKGSISQQRVNYNLDEQAYETAKDWFQQRMIAGMFFQLGGFNPTSFSYDGETYTGNERLALQGLNAPTAPSTHRSIFTGTGQTTENGVNGSTSATISLAQIDAAVAQAETQIAAVNNFKRIMGKPYRYVLFVGVKGWNQLLQQAQSNGNITYGQSVLNRLAGGEKGAMFIGDEFIYNTTKICKVPDHYMPNGINSNAVLANCKRALFCGTDAMGFGLGQGYTDAKDSIPGFNLVTDYDPIEDEIITKAQGIIGMKKAVVDTYDLSVIVLPHYVA